MHSCILYGKRKDCKKLVLCDFFFYIFFMCKIAKIYKYISRNRRKLPKNVYFECFSHWSTKILKYMQTTLLETFLLSVFECVRHQKAKKQRNNRIWGCKTTLWKMCLLCVFEFLLCVFEHSKHFLWRNKIIYTQKKYFEYFERVTKKNAKMYRIRGNERILWVTCIICVLSFVDFTLLGSKNQKCKQNNLWKKTTYQEICLLSVYERVRHQNEKKKKILEIPLYGNTK